MNKVAQEENAKTEMAYYVPVNERLECQAEYGEGSLGIEMEADDDDLYYFEVQDFRKGHLEMAFRAYPDGIYLAWQFGDIPWCSARIKANPALEETSCDGETIRKLDAYLSDNDKGLSREQELPAEFAEALKAALLQYARPSDQQDSQVSNGWEPDAQAILECPDAQCCVERPKLTRRRKPQNPQDHEGDSR